VGADGFGDAIRRKLGGEGVATDYLTTDEDVATGLMFRERRILSPAQVIYARGGSAGSRLTVDDIDRAADDGLFKGARWLHLSGITPALSDGARAATFRAAELARTAGLTISLDLNLRRRLWSDEMAAPVLRELAGGADVVLGSTDELAAVTGERPEAEPAELVRSALALGPSVAVVKLGANGALVATAESPGNPISRPGVPLPFVVDPVGAGDAFCAGFIAARLESLPFERALEYANACGAAATASLGDQTGLPGRSELLALLAADVGAPDTIR
jgi:2-dehydro-3-deoxygluconokinase